jgi:lipopolysaccharide transport system ATP-binding protein
MMMRLAFSVQTAVDPKILIVDEALAVGDMFFQAKCMARIRRLVDEGVTLLFVSHDAGVVRQLCTRAVLLAEGEMVGIGPSRTITDRYVKSVLDARNAMSVRAPSVEPSGRDVDGSDESFPVTLDDSTKEATEASTREFPGSQLGIESFLNRAKVDRTGNGSAEITNVQMLKEGDLATDYDFGDEAVIRVFVRFLATLENVMMAVKIRTLQGVDVVFLDTRIQNEMDRVYEKGCSYAFTWRVGLPMMHGSYALSVGLSHPPLLGEDWTFIDVIPHAYVFTVGPRKGGMIGGLVTLPASLTIAAGSPEDHPEQ